MGFQRAMTPEMGASFFPPGSPGALALLRAVWPSVVGAELGQRTEVLGLVENTLRVGVPDARWRTELHRLRGAILRGLREKAGALAPERLGFVEGVRPAPSPQARRVPEQGPHRLDALPATLLHEAQAIGDPEIRAAFLETAARYLARAGRNSGGQ